MSDPIDEMAEMRKRIETELAEKEERDERIYELRRMLESDDNKRWEQNFRQKISV